jgi:hypothetical protein
VTITSPAAQPSARRPRLTPGRSVALLIGVPFVLFIFAANGLSLVGSVGAGSYPVSAAIPLPGGTLSMNLAGGNVTLRGSDARPATARVAGTVAYHLARPSLRLGPGGIALGCPFVDQGNCSLNASIDVPAATALTAGSGGGDLSASGLSGPLTLSTDGGDLTVSDDTGDLTLTSGGGDVNASHVSGPVLTISTDGGNIGGTGLAAPMVTARTGGGDITLTFTAIPRDVEVRTDGGDVSIIVPPGAYIVSPSTDGGSVQAFSSTPGARNVIRASTGGGDITISES